MILLNLFRKNDPYLNIVLIIILVLLRLVFTFLGTLPINEGIEGQSYLMKEVFQLPLNEVGHVWLSGLFIGINTLLVNNIIRANQAFDENNYLTGLIFLILSHSDQRFFFLSGELIAMTCLLLALSLTISHVKNRANEENIFFTGCLIGLTVLFYSPTSIFYLLNLLIYLFFTRTVSRRYLLSSFGFIFPFIILYSILMFRESGLNLSFFFQGQFAVSISQLSWMNYLFIVIPLLITIGKLLVSFGGAKMTNHQIHVHRIMFLIILAAGYFLFADALGFGAVFFFTLPASYFISKYILELRKKWWRSTVFVLVLLHLAFPYLSATYF